LTLGAVVRAINHSRHPRPTDDDQKANPHQPASLRLWHCRGELGSQNVMHVSGGMHGVPKKILVRVATDRDAVEAWVRYVAQSERRGIGQQRVEGAKRIEADDIDAGRRSSANCCKRLIESSIESEAQLLQSLLLLGRQGPTKWRNG